MAKINEWLEDDKLLLLEGWARDGLTLEQIANNMGIDTSTLWDWRKKNDNISNAIKKGKEVVDIEVENALFKRAIGYTKKLLKQKVDKNGKVIDTYEEIEVPPDTTAQIFWLKNRLPQKWRDKIEPINTDDNKKEGIIIDLLEAIKDAKTK